MKEQFTASDARTDRMVRKVQEQMDGLRASVQTVTEARGEMLKVDIAAVAADPAAGAMLPAAVLARALAEERVEHKRTRATVTRRDKRVKELNSRLRTTQHEKAFLEGRLHTFEETLRALYSNLEDLRQLRDVHLGVDHLSAGAHEAEFEPVALDTHRQRFVEAGDDPHDIAADG
jgi:methionine-rich copper-binding protein CopC